MKKAEYHAGSQCGAGRQQALASGSAVSGHSHSVSFWAVLPQPSHYSADSYWHLQVGEDRVCFREESPKNLKGTGILKDNPDN